MFGIPYLDLGLLSNGLLLLVSLLLALISIGREVDLDTETVSYLVDTSTLSANDTSNEFAVDFELS